ncbi:hypothetical protein EYF80_066614 [Liparis tanakae]|uniref:Uncharacterized protein n=1 Tax=Liparis tanakae TaxID=230148 RepID=A0A4Z2E3D0_9TELE|nr:hypothetical protein EYF80_066614 [Liparis tanakae]
MNPESQAGPGRFATSIKGGPGSGDQGPGPAIHLPGDRAVRMRTFQPSPGGKDGLPQIRPEKTNDIPKNLPGLPATWRLRPQTWQNQDHWRAAEKGVVSTLVGPGGSTLTTQVNTTTRWAAPTLRFYQAGQEQMRPGAYFFELHCSTEGLNCTRCRGFD